MESTQRRTQLCIREANARTAAGNNLETWKSRISGVPGQWLKSAVKELDHQGKSWHNNLSLPTSFTKTASHMYGYPQARLPKQKTRNSGAALLHMLEVRRGSTKTTTSWLRKERKKKNLVMFSSFACKVFYISLDNYKLVAYTHITAWHKTKTKRPTLHPQIAASEKLNSEQNTNK